MVILERQGWRALAPALQRGTLRVAIGRLASNLRDVDWTHVENARQVALEKETGAVATLPRGLALVVGYDRLMIGAEARVRTASPAKDLPQMDVERIELELDRAVPIPGSDWQVFATLAPVGQVTDRWTARLDFAKCKGVLALRRRHPGDRFQPQGLQGHSKSLHEFMIDEKIPRVARERLPILVADDRILWVCGWQVDERARVTPDTNQVLQITLTKKGTR